MMETSHTSHAERDIAWIEKWVDIAGELGAQCARVIGGKAEPSKETLHFLDITRYAFNV